ncbi:MAG: hypothetical protein ACFFDT_00335 [Candidatus Hodarchaeota archaeon]
MTESYGYYCLKCHMRWRVSVCPQGECPSGHDLKDAYMIYRKTASWGFKVSIKGKDLNLREYIYVSEEDYLACNRYLHEWADRKAQEQPQFKELFYNVLESSSMCEQAWRIKCWDCQYAQNRGYYPGTFDTSLRKVCSKGHEWLNIYCTDFAYDGGPKLHTERTL